MKYTIFERMGEGLARIKHPVYGTQLWTRGKTRNRTFQNLHRHMKTKHPDYSKETE